MSNLNINEMITIPMPILGKSIVINSKKNSALTKEVIIMTNITEDEYNTIKKGQKLIIARDFKEYTIEPDDIYCFGVIDFTEGSADCVELDSFKWLDNLDFQGKCIPSRYNYKTHECVSPIKKYLYTETFRNSTLCRYLHGCISKPNLTLIFRQIV